MNLPENLQKALNNNIYNIKNLKIDAKNISESYRNNTGKNLNLLNNSTQTIAYATSRMPATFAACFSVFNHVFELIDNKPKTILDIGAGTGAATWALTELLEFESIDCFEREQEMINLGKKLMESNPFNSKINWLKFDLRKHKINKKYDLIIASYVLNEFNQEERMSILKELWNSTNDLLIIIEPGTPHNFEQIKIMREFLINKGGNIIAPCPHANKCKLTNDWCNFTARINRSQTHKALKGGSSPFEDEKFSYIAFSKKQVVNAYNRVIRHPQYLPKLVNLKLCGPEEIKNLTITKSNVNYKNARNINHGDIFNLE